MTLIYTPLDIPKIVPNNWDEWWEVWNNYSTSVTKTKQNHNPFNQSKLWKGFDLYRQNDVFKKYTLYETELAPQVSVILDLVEQVKKYCIFEPALIRVMENLITIPPHSDYKMPGHYEFRSILWNTYKTPIWQFTHDHETRDMHIPNDTNSFYYLDHPVQHASIYDSNYSKGLIVVYGPLVKNTTEIIDRSIKKYKDIAWIV